MGIFGTIGKIIVGGVLGGPPGALLVFTVQHGPKVIEGTIDVARQIVKIGTDVYKAIPPEVIALGGQPLHGLLKHEAEDELILLGHIAGEVAIFSGLYWSALGPVGASLQIAQGAIPLYVTVGSLVGKLHHRLLNNQEWEMARYIFRGSLYDREEIILTNLAGKDGRAFVYPIGPLSPVLVNLGNRYVHNATTPDGPTLFHELTHVWQAKQRVLREIFLYDALERKYDFTHGRQWSEYNLEQQASIVEAWTRGAIERSGGRFPQVHNKFAINSSLFRYINGNVRRSANGARTGDGRSVRQLLAEGSHRSMKAMHPRPPQVWWA
jgi:hypothetical protein